VLQADTKSTKLETQVRVLVEGKEVVNHSYKQTEFPINISIPGKGTQSVNIYYDNVQIAEKEVDFGE
ncbi:MAG: hypothetical protein H7Y41_01710, partial [Hyphomonadaceae bacterium]|nr:hypothetical protein [Clostridia bacterium]